MLAVPEDIKKRNASTHLAHLCRADECSFAFDSRLLFTRRQCVDY